MLRTWLHAAGLVASSFSGLPELWLDAPAKQTDQRQTKPAARPANDEQPFLRAAD